MARAMPHIQRLLDHSTQAFRTGYIIFCPACRTKDILETKSFNNPPPWELFAKHFRHKGWEINGHADKDRCPSCVDREKAERRAKHHPHQTTAHTAAQALFAPRPQRPELPENYVQLRPAFHQFGPTWEQIKELQAKFNDPLPTEPGAIRKRMAQLQDLITKHQNEFRTLETRLKGRPVLRLAAVARHQ